MACRKWMRPELRFIRLLMSNVQKPNMNKKTKKIQNNKVRKIIRNSNSRHAITIVAAVLLFLLYLIIFTFSGQNGEQSGGLSYMISEKCVGLMNSLSGRHWTALFQQDLAIYFEHPIRKLAHFSEYACMGVLVYTMWRPWKHRGKRLYGLTILWVLLSASADEFHQLFVPERYGSFTDVCLDTCGGAFGVLICVLFEKLYYRRKKKS